MRNVTLLASAARSATTTTPDVRVIGGKGIFVFDVTAVTGGQTVTLKIQGKDSTSGKYYDIITGAAQGSTGTTVLRVGDGLTAAANLTVNDILPDVIRAVVTHSTAVAFTYSVGAIMKEEE